MAFMMSHNCAGLEGYSENWTEQRERKLQRMEKKKWEIETHAKKSRKLC